MKWHTRTPNTVIVPSNWHHYYLCHDDGQQLVEKPAIRHQSGGLFGIRSLLNSEQKDRYQRFEGNQLTEISKETFELWLQDPDLFWMERLL